MPTIVRLSGTVRLCMYAGDHGPPHFHVLTGDGNAFMVRLDTLQVLAGRVDPKALALATRWADRNPALLAERWSDLNG